MNTNDLARWIVEHGADKPAKQPEVGIPLYLPIPEPPPKSWRDSVEVNYEINYEV